MSGPGFGPYQPYEGPPPSGPPPIDPYAPNAAQYPQGYPPGYPVPGYPPAGYPGGYFPLDPRDVRPGITMASAVLAYVSAGLLIFTGGLLLLGASIINEVQDATDGHTGYDTEFGLDGLANLVAAALLIAGGVMLSGRNPAGRVVLSVGSAIVAAESLYWLIRFADSVGTGVVFYAVLFGAMAIVSTVLCWLTPVGVWLAARR